MRISPSAATRGVRLRWSGLARGLPPGRDDPQAPRSIRGRAAQDGRRFDRVRDGFFDERPRWSDLTELPLGVGEAGSRDRAGIPTEAESGLTIPLGIVNAQRLN